MGSALLADKARLEGEGPTRQKILGRYEKGMDTDWEAVERTTKIAVEASSSSSNWALRMCQRLVDALCATTPAAGEDPTPSNDLTIPSAPGSTLPRN